MINGDEKTFMKKRKETWLIFFKKISLGILLLIIVLSLFAFYMNKNYPNGKTYLNCEDRYFAFYENTFGGGTMYFLWDSVEQEWKTTREITKINKQIIQVDLETRPDGVKEGEVYTPIKSYFIFDRVEGNVKHKYENEEKKEFDFKCIKISRRNLPTTKIDQKF